MKHSRNYWLQRSKSTSHLILCRTANQPDCPTDILEALYYAHNKYFAFNIISNPSCPRSVMKEVITSTASTDWIHAAQLIDQPHCPTDILVQLLSHSNVAVRRAAASRM